jgi:serine/threonine protein kinase
MSADEGNDRLLNSCPDCGAVLDVSIYGPYQKVVCPACHEAIRVRTQFDHFEIQRKLGEGGMSLVFEARDAKLGRHVALKILHPEFSRREELMRQFEREARLTAAISHQNVVEVYSVGRDQGYFYIAMELVGGGSLEELIEEEGKIGENRALEIGTQVAQGLRAAHKGSLIHRDIKPGNILFSESKVAKIVDFGLALVAGNVDESDDIWATPYYVPPEKLDDAPEDARSDIYSLGATLFHALAGKPPFRADTASIDELKVLKAQPISMKEAAPETSAETCRVIDRMLRHDPDDRQHDYDELIAELNKASGVLAGSEVYESETKRPRIRMATVIILLVGAFLIWYLPKHDSGDTDDGGNELPDFGSQDTGSVASHGQDFSDARRLLIDGNSKGALMKFEALAAHADVQQPMRNWARVNAGIGSLLRGDGSSSRAQFQAITDDGLYTEVIEEQDVAYFFLWISDHLSKPLPVMPEQLSVGEGGSDLAPLAWFLYGLKNWDHGRFEEALPFLESFRDATPPKRLEWLALYQPLADPYLEDIALIRRLPKPSSAMNGEESEEIIRKVEVLNEQFKTRGAAARLAGERLERAKVHLAKLEDEAARREAARMAQAELEAQMRRKEEMARLEELVSSIGPLGEALQFEDAAKVLAEARFEDAIVAQRLGDYQYACQQAGKFLDTLISDLDRVGFSGEIRRSNGSVLTGEIMSAADGEVRVKLSFGETVIPVSSLAIDGLVEIARQLPQRMTDPLEAHSRLEILCFFARQSGREELAAALAKELTVESDDFGARWERMRENESLGTRNPS